MKEVVRGHKLWPANFQAWHRLGTIYRGSNRIPAAIEAFRKAIQANEEFYPAYFGLAESYLATNTNLQEALQLAETANRMAPKNRQEELVSAILQKLQKSR